MGSIIMDNCVVGENSIIGAGAVLPQNTIVSPGSVYAGVPAKKIKSIDAKLQNGEVERIAKNYMLTQVGLKPKKTARKHFVKYDVIF